MAHSGFRDQGAPSGVLRAVVLTSYTSFLFSDFRVLGLGLGFLTGVFVWIGGRNGSLQ